MGNASIVPKSAPTALSSIKSHEHVHVADVLEYVMPIYYTKIPILPHCKEKLINGWKKISSNKAEGFQKLKKEHPDQVPCATSMDFFANRLVIRLCEVHPVCQTMFKKNNVKQGTLFLNMFSMLIKEMDNAEAFNKVLKMLATSHLKMGIRATECK